MCDFYSSDCLLTEECKWFIAHSVRRLLRNEINIKESEAKKKKIRRALYENIFAAI
jgi:hypothetical protein